jgi:Peptidase family M23
MRVLVGLLVAAAVLAAAPPAAADDGWMWPVEGRVLTLYSNDNGRPYAGGMHRGIDIAAERGAGVVAARAGTVSHAGVVGSAGLTVAVRTGDGRHVTSYLHLGAVAVKKGDTIAAGVRIGAVGTSGRRSVAEPHLHFGVRLAEAEDHYLDPLSVLPAARPGPAPAPAPSPVPVPVRAAPVAAPVPVAIPLRASPARAPARAPVRVRPRGTLQPGPAVAPEPIASLALRPRHARRPQGVPTGPAPQLRPAPSRLPVPAAGRATSPAGHAGPGRGLVLGGLGVIALALFGGMAWRAVARANAGVNTGAGAAAAALRERARIGPTLRRLLLFR